MCTVLPVRYVVSDQPSAVANTGSSDIVFIGQWTIVSVHHHRFDWLPAGVTDRISMRRRRHARRSVESCSAKGDHHWLKRIVQAIPVYSPVDCQTRARWTSGQYNVTQSRPQIRWRTFTLARLFKPCL